MADHQSGAIGKAVFSIAVIFHYIVTGFQHARAGAIREAAFTDTEPCSALCAVHANIGALRRNRIERTLALRIESL